MYVAASTRCFSELDIPAACSALGDLEYTKYELWFSPESPATDPAQLVGRVEEFEADLRSATRLTPIAITLDQDFSEEVLLAVAKLSKSLRVAQLTIPASPLGTPFNTEIDRLRHAVRVGSEHGVRVSIKTRTGDLSEDPHTANELCQSVKGLGITLDPSYYVCGPNQGRSYDMVFPHVTHLHLRDTKPDSLQVPTGLGEIDYSRLVAQLNKEAYSGSMSVELIPSLLDLETRPLELRKLRMLLETLE